MNKKLYILRYIENFQSKSNSGGAERYLVQLWKNVLNCVEYRYYRCRHNSTQFRIHKLVFGSKQYIYRRQSCISIQ